ncbi:MAG: D-aminoacyl-tRNA deacylase [Flavobacteriaceae bacterium]|nr:D-aminoacyl-tRNA deacylase [Flavobacteriaceae bacterium]MCI5088656.1 D-aminoacyl-tRNA deacylase [Flavobacteriaceae bacterium]
MRVVVQRVSEAAVAVHGKSTATIGKGLLVLVGITQTDGLADIEWLAQKVVNLRIFEDHAGQMNCSLLELGLDLIVVSQFTLFAATKKGNRPSYIRAAKPEIAIPIYEQFVNKLEELIGKAVGTGVFGADMKVSLINDGPVTITIDSQQKE